MSIYSVVDLAVSRRTREIGVRVALGASPRSILGAIFKRPLRHIAVAWSGKLRAMAFEEPLRSSAVPSIRPPIASSIQNSVLWNHEDNARY
jgi:hypothetical protein